MSWKVILQIAAGAVLWIGAIIAACFGFWLPLLLLAGGSAVVLAVFAGPALWQRLTDGEAER